MSAYGTILRPSDSSNVLSPTVWKMKTKHNADESSSPQFVVMYHMTLATALQSLRAGLVSFMHEEFADEVERGDTYPQEPLDGARLTREAFEGYFFTADAVIGIVASGADLQCLGLDISVTEETGIEWALDFDAVRNGREWKDCVAGFYYVKPNYPGRSSHICNAGFVVPFSSRGKGYANILARSYLHYGPKLGYQATVFNLVYVNNAASIRLWEKLNFTKAGLIPKAGRLRRKDGQGEEYVDAWVFYRSFEVVDAGSTGTAK